MLASNNGRVDLCRVLIDAGADVNSVDGRGFTPLSCACIDLPLAAEREEAGLRCDPAGVVSFLLEQGARSDAAAADGLTALQLCLQHEDQDHECPQAQACALLLKQAKK